jgi:serine/threonine protein kinase
MRFIRGDSLREAVERLHQTADFADVAARRLELRKLVGRLVDVCHAVAYAHSRGVLHRDLKPGNIMLGKYGETLVVDWGLAKSVGRPDLYRSGEEGTVVPTSGDASSDTRMGMVVGTLAYMSPEQAEGRLDAVGPLSDVYSLGSTLYCILTGKAPIEKEDATEMIAAVRLGRYRKPRELAAWVPPALEAICLKAMSLHPVSRYASPTALADELELWLADEPVSAWREPWPARVARWSRRNRSLIGTAIGGLTATTAAAVVIMGLVSAQNADLRAKNVAIERGNAEILRQRDMLDQNRGLLSELSVGVLTAAETQLANVSGVDLFRSSVMERSFRTFEQLYQQDKSNPEVATYLAQSARLSGNQLSRVAQRPAAIERLQMSIDLQRKSPQTAAGDTAALDYLAGTLRDLGEIQSSQGRLSDAQKSFTEAADILATMLAKAPQNPNIRRTAATLSLPQASLLLELDKFEQALGLSMHSAKVLVELSESPFANPVDPVLAMLAIAQQGRTLDELGRHAEAREVFANGIAKGRDWMQKFADSMDMKYAFSRLLHWDTDGNVRGGSVTEERIQQLDEAIGMCEELQQAKPQSLGYLYNLGDARRTRGRIFREKMMYPEATEILQKSADVLKRRLEVEVTASSHEILSATVCEQAETQLAQANKPAAAEFWKTAVQHLQQAEQLSPESQSIKRSLQTVEERLKAAGE